jgi:hypothetical protein
VDAVLRLKGSTNLDAIQIIKKPGGTIKVRSQLCPQPAACACAAPFGLAHLCPPPRLWGRRPATASCPASPGARWPPGLPPASSPACMGARRPHLLCHAALLQDSFLDEGFILDKRIGVGQPKRIENARILVANTGEERGVRAAGSGHPRWVCRDLLACVVVACNSQTLLICVVGAPCEPCSMSSM